MNIKDAFAILKSNQFNDYKEVRKSYIDLVSVWHPDRFTHNEGLRKKAIEEMKQINIAWEIIKEDFKVRNISYKSQQATPADKNTSDILIRCKHCGTKNRILKEPASVSSIKCGKCRKILCADAHSTSIKNDESFAEIRFCTADTCSGRIQPDGQCDQCGKTREEILQIRAAAHQKKRIVIFIYMVAGGVICFFSCCILLNNTTKAPRIPQLPYEMKSSMITKRATKESSHFNESGAELPVSVDGNTQKSIAKDIIIPFEIIKK